MPDVNIKDTTVKNTEPKDRGDFIIIAFYTKNTPYEAYAKEFETHLKSLNLPVDYYIEGLQSSGTWVRNCNLKPIFCLHAMQRFNKKLLYLDLDARITNVDDVTAYVSEYDSPKIGAHFLNGVEVLSASLIIPPEAIHALEKWVDASFKQPDVWDQKLLPVEDLCDIPQRFCQIFDKPGVESGSIIQHQISRKFKGLVNNVDVHNELDIPKVMNNIRIRTAPDNSIFITRQNAVVEKYLDDKLIRIDKSLHWLPCKKDANALTPLRPYFEGNGCYIVGKGPSIDNLKALDFAEGFPIICLNESIHKVCELNIRNQIFVLQQDVALGSSCVPKRGGVIMLMNYRNAGVSYDSIYYYIPEQYNCKNNTLSAICAIEIAKFLGTSSFVMLGFDSINGDYTYAKCIGYESSRGGRPERFKKHGDTIIARLDRPHEFRWPLIRDTFVDKDQHIEDLSQSSIQMVPQCAEQKQEDLPLCKHGLKFHI